MADGGDALKLGGLGAGFRLTAARRNWDLATALGLAGGAVLLLGGMAVGGSLLAFYDLPSILIVLGGTFCVTLTAFSTAEMARTFTIVGKAFSHTSRDPGEAAIGMIRLSEQARRAGILSLQGVLPELQPEPFLYKGLAMVVDGSTGEEIEAVLARDIQATIHRHHRSAGVLRKAAEVAPAMGLIGTLIGLVQMLGNLDDPSTIGPSMAVALITTFYGAVLANMVFAPLAAKLERNSGEELLVNQLYMMGAVSISRQENPRRLEMLLNSVLPPARRVQYFD